MERIKNIMVACDFSEYSKQALQYASNLAENLKACLIITHVINQRDIDAMQKIAKYTATFSLEKFVKDQFEDRSQRIDKLIEETVVYQLPIKKNFKNLPCLSRCHIFQRLYHWPPSNNSFLQRVLHPYRNYKISSSKYAYV